MALVLADRVKETSVTAGTGTFTLDGAVNGYQTFGAAIGSGNTCYYTIAGQVSSDWEVGIGTVGSGTLARTTVLASSNGGSLVNFIAGTKDVFVTYPAEKSVYRDASGDTVQNSFSSITSGSIALTTGTISTAPSASTDIVNKTYVDGLVAAGVNYHTPVRLESPNTAGNLNATYNNGASGVGATLTNAGTQVALTIDGVATVLGDRVLIYNQTNQAENGVYTVTNVGSGSTNWVLTRATDANTYGPGPNALDEGSAFYVTAGNTGAGETYVCSTVGTIVFGTTPITFAQISSAQIYSAGTGLTLTNTTFSITNTAVTAGSYGSASSVPNYTVNAQGQLTSAANTPIAITSAAVSGLAASATTDTTNASNISSGTLPSARLSGSYTGITGVGTIAAGTWQGSAIGAAYGGTGFTGYTTGDIIYASGASTLAKLAAGTNGYVLTMAAGVPSWAANSAVTTFSAGTTGLTPSTATSGAVTLAGTLNVANGGTGVTTLTGYVKGSGSSAFTASSTIPNTDITGLGTMSTQNASSVAITGGSINGTSLGATTAGSAKVTTLDIASGLTLATLAGTSGQVLTSAGAGFVPTWTTPTTGTVTSVAASVPSFLSVSGSPITTSGTLAISYSGTALPVANGGTGLTSITTSRIPYGNGTGALNTSANLIYNGTTLAVGGFSPPTFTGASSQPYGYIVSNALATTLNATSDMLSLGNSNGNMNYLRIFQYRNTAAGADWTTATTRIQAITDVTNQGYIDFNPISGNYGLAFGNGSTEYARIANGGNVGIGTSSPAQKLQVSSSTDAVALVSGGSASAGYMAVNGNARSNLTGATVLLSYSTGAAELTNRSNSYFVFGTNNTEQVRITATGGVSFGSSGTAYGTSGQVLTSNGNAPPTWATPAGSNITALGLWENNATISANYTIGTGNNAVSAGPITVASGVVVTVPSGSTWVVV